MIEQEIARYFSRLSALTKIGLSKRSPSANMNEADVGNLTSEVETDRTRQKIKRDLAKFRRILQERSTPAALGYKKFRPLHLTFLPNLLSLSMHENNWLCLRIFSSREICRKTAGSYSNEFYIH